MNIIPIGTETRFGKISMIRTINGERYYYMVNKYDDVAMIPASTLEEMMED